jgi:cellobiose-specific phosphotransferase system component IIB
VLEGLVLGHPDILRKFNIAIKAEELEKQCKVEKVFKGTNGDQGSNFDFVELAPEVFYMIRRI